jgi:hypothetical protein
MNFDPNTLPSLVRPPGFISRDDGVRKVIQRNLHIICKKTNFAPYTKPVILATTTIYLLLRNTTT